MSEINIDVTIGEASSILGFSQGQIRDLEEGGKIVSTKTSGGHRRFNLQDVYDFLLPPKINRKLFKQLVDISCVRLEDKLRREFDVLDPSLVREVKRRKIYQAGWDWYWNISKYMSEDDLWLNKSSDHDVVQDIIGRDIFYCFPTKTKPVKSFSKYIVIELEKIAVARFETNFEHKMCGVNYEMRLDGLWTFGDFSAVCGE